MDGIPACANHKINNDYFRDTRGFAGFMVSDCDAVSDFISFPQVNITTDAQAAALGINGGLDVDCGQHLGPYTALGDSVKQGLVSEVAVRTAAVRLFTKQIALGILDSDVPFSKIGAEMVDNEYHRSLAVEAAKQTIVLLRNENVTHAPDGKLAPALPLLRSAKMALIGPHLSSTVSLLGDYHGVNLQVLNRSVLDVAKSHGLDASYAVGCSIDGTDDSGFPNAIDSAKKADVAVMFLGIDPTLEGEGHDRTNLTLPRIQLELAAQVAQVQPHTIVVLINGGVLAIESLISGQHAVPAVLEAFYPGQGGAEAIIQTLVGDSNPSGKLPNTVYPASFIQRNKFDFDLQSDGGCTYRYYNGSHGDALFPFGWGLSYTKFSYSWKIAPMKELRIGDLRSSGGECFDCSQLQYTVTVTNDGSIAGAAVVLGFVSSNANSSTFVNKALFDFGRVLLNPGESKALVLKAETGCKQSISSVDGAGRRWLEPGPYRITVGDLETGLQVSGDREEFLVGCNSACV